MKVPWNLIVLFLTQAIHGSVGTYVTKYVVPGDEVTITCQIAGKHVWRFENEIILADNFQPDDVELDNVEGEIVNDALSYLSINGFRESNVGNYSCFMNGLLVFRYMLDMNVSNSVIAMCVLPGDSVPLTCNVIAHSTQNISWWYNDILVPSDNVKSGHIGLENVRIEEQSSGASMLLIDPMLVANVGNYSCFVESTKRRTFLVDIKDPKLKLQVKGEDDIEVAYLAAGILFEVSCFSQSFGILINTTMIIEVTSTSTNTTLELSKRETKVNERLTILELGNNDVEVAIFCKSYDSSGFLYGEEMTKRNVYVIPELRFQIGGVNVTSRYEVEKGELVILSCIAFGSRPRVSLYWKGNYSRTESLPDTIQSRNKHVLSTMDYKIVLALHIDRERTVSCHTDHGKADEFNGDIIISLSMKDAVSINSPVIYIAIPVLVFCIVIATCISICLLKRRKHLKDRNLDPSSINPMKGLSCPQPPLHRDTDKKGPMELYSERIQSDIYYSEIEPRQGVNFISLLPGGSMFKYWKASSSSFPRNEFIVANTIAGYTDPRNQGKSIIDFISNIHRRLEQNSNIIRYLGCSTEKVPHYMYVEYLENGNLQDYLIKTYQPRRRTILQNPGQILPNGLQHPVLFAKDVANALEFLHQNELCHPGLSSTKVLLNERVTCKLYDFWPIDHTSEKIIHLRSRDNQTLERLPPETKESSIYGFPSDIWSFGIFLWQIFSFGEVPCQQIYSRKISEDQRESVCLSEPPFCPPGMFEMMLKMWDKSCGKRPILPVVQSQAGKQNLDGKCYMTVVSADVE
ncbi:uncharacterized protein [Apostichopus japonicus]|uniref:uncharacterized protein isoform X2 n=1 Tax=Stichopus japonicus TaxID=307972 RepID=UPI003AB7E2DA